MQGCFCLSSKSQSSVGIRKVKNEAALIAVVPASELRMRPIHSPWTVSLNSGAIFFNHGQCCCAGSRLFAGPQVREELVERVTEIARHTKLGDGFDPETDMGPLVSQLVEGPFDPDFNEFLEPVGVRLATRPGTKPEPGVALAARSWGRRDSARDCCPCDTQTSSPYGRSQCGTVSLLLLLKSKTP